MKKRTNRSYLMDSLNMSARSRHVYTHHRKFTYEVVHAAMEKGLSPRKIIDDVRENWESHYAKEGKQVKLRAIKDLHKWTQSKLKDADELCTKYGYTKSAVYHLVTISNGRERTGRLHELMKELLGEKRYRDLRFSQTVKEAVEGHKNIDLENIFPKPVLEDLKERNIRKYRLGLELYSGMNLLRVWKQNRYLDPVELASDYEKYLTEYYKVKGFKKPFVYVRNAKKLALDKLESEHRSLPDYWKELGVTCEMYYRAFATVKKNPKPIVDIIGEYLALLPHEWEGTRNIEYFLTYVGRLDKDWARDPRLLDFRGKVVRVKDELGDPTEFLEEEWDITAI